MKKFLSILSLGLVVAVACNKDPEEKPRTLDEFSVNPDVVTVSEGDNFKLRVTATPVYDDMELTFVSSNEDVATVDAKGAVNAVAAGEAVITVSNNIDKKTAECKVTVNEVVTLNKIVVEPATLELSVGQTAQVSVTPEPALPDLEYVWSSNNTDVCTVDNEGNVTAVAEGITAVRVTERTYGKSATVNVKVSIRLFSGGKGTPSDPYQIASQEDLKLLAEYSLGGETLAKYAFEKASYIVTKDITFTPFNEAGDTVNVLGTPWGTSDKPFKGTFDGNNKKISGLFMGSYFSALDPAFNPSFDENTSINYATGLIGFAEGATIKNVILENPHIQSTGVNVGGIVGAAASTQIVSCKVIGGVPSDCYDGGKLVSDGDVSITTKGGAYIYGKGKYLSAKDTSAPFGEDQYQFSYGLVGGIVGQAKDSWIDGCSVNAYVRCVQRNVGAIAGIITGSSQVTNCTAEGLVHTKMTNSGGLVGTMFGASTAIEGCTVKNVFMSKYSYGGCITGMCCAGGMIKDCVVDGASACLYNPADAANFIGGVIGYIKLKPVTIENCKVVNTSVTATGYGIAGILGRNDCSVTIKNCYVGNCNLEGLKTYEQWSKFDPTKDAKGGYWVGGIVGQVNTSALSNSVAVIDNCNVETDIKASFCAGGIFATSSTKNDGTTPIYVSNVAYRGKLITWHKNAYHHAMCGGIAGNPNSTTKGSTLHIVNCYAFPEIELSSVATAGSTAGLLGYSQNNVQLLIGYSNITRDQIIKNTDGTLAPIPENQLRYGGILGVTNCNAGAANGDQFLYRNLYYSDQIQFGVSNTKDAGGAYVFDCEECGALAAAEFKNGTLLEKLNAAVTAYNANSNKKATASMWVAGSDGFPTISGLPTGK